MTQNVASPEVFTIRKTFKFEAAHRLMTSFSKKCQQIHGHSYKLELFLQSNELNEDGMMIDFGKLKELFRESLEQFDHKIVLSVNDEVRRKLFEAEIEGVHPDLGVILVEFNPTAENMAKFFYELLEEEFYANEEIRHIQILAVRVHETETGWAQFSRLI